MMSLLMLSCRPEDKTLLLHLRTVYQYHYASEEVTHQIVGILVRFIWESAIFIFNSWNRISISTLDRISSSESVSFSSTIQKNGDISQSSFLMQICHKICIGDSHVYY